ncbi:MAG TPA: class I SAM-dependent methyltransferase [Vicinamibacteria bacterium]|nr:class I SAM-dependent methyltransferase [Vicinamibacteria bacterium]
MTCGTETPCRPLFALERTILRCERCGLVFADPEGAPAHDYSESYYRGGVYADYLMERGAIRRNAQRSLAALESLVPGRRLLDVGCAAGFFLEAARDRGWSVRGLDVSAYAAAFARDRLGLPVLLGSIVVPPQGLEDFDVVTLWDAIEHLDRPDLALLRIRERLREGGVLALSTGDYGSLLRRITGRRWRLFRDPTHNFFFDRETLRRLLERGGFEVLSVSRRGKWVSLAMSLHQSRLPRADRLRDLLVARGLDLGLYVNLRDVMTVVARPRVGWPAPGPGSPAGSPAASPV